MEPYTFETERLVLRPASLEDAAFTLALLNSPKWLQFIGDRKVYTLTEAEGYIQERMMPQLERLGYGNFMVVRKEDNVLIGCCGLYDREGLDGVDIGFAFLPENEGKGYAFEAAQKVKEAAFGVLGLSKIGAITIEANTGSRKLLEKLGLEFIKNIRLENDPEELMYYEITKPMTS